MALLERFLDDYFQQHLSAPARTGLVLVDHLFRLTACYLFGACYHKHYHWLSKADSFIARLMAISFNANDPQKDCLYSLLASHCKLYIYRPSSALAERILALVAELQKGDPEPCLCGGEGMLLLANALIGPNPRHQRYFELFFQK